MTEAWIAQGCAEARRLLEAGYLDQAAEVLGYVERRALCGARFGRQWRRCESCGARYFSAMARQRYCGLRCQRRAARNRQSEGYVRSYLGLTGAPMTPHRLEPLPTCQAEGCAGAATVQGRLCLPCYGRLSGWGRAA